MNSVIAMALRLSFSYFLGFFHAQKCSLKSFSALFFMFASLQTLDCKAENCSDIFFNKESSCNHLLSKYNAVDISTNHHMDSNISDMFLGGTSGFTSLAKPHSIDDIKSTKRVGYYLHFSATDPQLFGTALPKIAKNFGSPEDGLVELSLGGGFNAGFWKTPAWNKNIVELGFHPFGAVVNLSLDLSPRAKSALPLSAVTQWANFISAGRNLGGVKIFSPIVSPNQSGGTLPDGDKDTVAVFAPWNSEFWSVPKLLARQGGGISLDSPPSYFFKGLPTEPQRIAYRQFCLDVIKWSNENLIQSFWIISPFFDGKQFRQDAIEMYRYLYLRGALPNHWIFENYNECDLPYERACVAHTDAAWDAPVGVETEENSEAGVALWFAQNAAIKSLKR